jgi:hypothetical protein
VKKTTAAALAVLVLTLAGCAAVCAILPAAVELAEARLEAALADDRTNPTEETALRLAAAYAAVTAARLAFDQACSPGLVAMSATTEDGQTVVLLSADPVVYEVDGERRTLAEELAALEREAP